MVNNEVYNHFTRQSHFLHTRKRKNMFIYKASITLVRDLELLTKED